MNRPDSWAQWWETNGATIKAAEAAGDKQAFLKAFFAHHHARALFEQETVEPTKRYTGKLTEIKSS